MEAAVGPAKWLLGKVLKKLSDDLEASYMASWGLSLNVEEIQRELMYTQGLLEAAQERDIEWAHDGLQQLLQHLSRKAEEAEDALDELHYFQIQDELEGTRKATLEMGTGLSSRVIHGRHAVRHAVGNFFPCFSCSPTQDDAKTVAAATDAHKAKAKSVDVGRLPFDRVAMSKKIKSLVEASHSISPRVSDLLKTSTGSNSDNKGKTARLARPDTGSTITQNKLYGRADMFEQTIKDITSGTYQGTLSVLPIVGPGGIGKTTFTQHIYNDERIQKYFKIKIWICVSTKFDVLKLSQDILSCILHATKNEGGLQPSEMTNLDQLQKSIEQSLKSNRILVVLDDIWGCNGREGDWTNLLAPLTKGGTEGNMVLVTTRFPYVADMVKTADQKILKGLEPTEFWEFFQACVYGDVMEENDKFIDTARAIANKLKCSPLAAKTVGRLLRNNRHQKHWVDVLENKMWETEEREDDIMPALKISYDYLPYHLKKCFSYLSLFPEDHRFGTLEITRFWIAIGIVDFTAHTIRTEDAGLKYLNELVDNGFLMKEDDNNYIMHDLFHELAVNVSLQDCANINCCSFKPDDIPTTIRHLSITIQKKYYDENFEKEMDKLKNRIDVKNLRSLMIFVDYMSERTEKVIKDTFDEIKDLRILFIFMNSPGSLPQNFSKLIHLRYLKIESPVNQYMLPLPRTLCRFYHLKFLDLTKWHGIKDLSNDINQLVNLRHFLATKEFHSNVSEVGKMRFLEELKEFHVKKESVGFELEELGKLTNLGGRLSICNLENVRTKKEASEANLMAKRNITKLKLVWCRDQQTIDDDDIADCLQPHSSLRRLCIVNHGGPTCPHWLCSGMSTKNLETLHLEGVSWDIRLLPFGQMRHLRRLKLKNIAGIRQFGFEFSGVTDTTLLHLERVVFDDMPELVEWVGGVSCHNFPKLQSIVCAFCPNLSMLPFSQCSGSSANDKSTIWFPNLCSLEIVKCPRLSLPAIPHTPTLTSIRVEEDHPTRKVHGHRHGMLVTERYRKQRGLDYEQNRLVLNKYNGALAFHNLDQVREMEIEGPSGISLKDLQKMSSLRNLRSNCISMFCKEFHDGIVLHSLKTLQLYGLHLTRKALSEVFRCLPGLSYLMLTDSTYECHQEQVLQLSCSSLCNIHLNVCEDFILPSEEGAGLWDPTALQSLDISECGIIFSNWFPGGPAEMKNKPFPTSLRELYITKEPSMFAMSLLSNLTHLTHLEIVDCHSLTMDGFNPLITFNLKKLVVYNGTEHNCSSTSVAADILTEVTKTKTIPAGSFQLEHLEENFHYLKKLEHLEVDSISAVLVAPLCTHLSATLHTLIFRHDVRVETFTEEQEQALQLLISLKCLQFSYCESLQSFPTGLHRLSSLTSFVIHGCHKIMSLPKKGLPASLKDIGRFQVSDELAKEFEKLKATSRPNLSLHI